MRSPATAPHSPASGASVGSARDLAPPSVCPPQAPRAGEQGRRGDDADPRGLGVVWVCAVLNARELRGLSSWRFVVLNALCLRCWPLGVSWDAAILVVCRSPHVLGVPTRPRRLTPKLRRGPHPRTP